MSRTTAWTPRTENVDALLFDTATLIHRLDLVADRLADGIVAFHAAAASGKGMGQDFHASFALDSEMLPMLAHRIDRAALAIKKYGPEALAPSASQYRRVYRQSEVRSLRDAYEHRDDWILNTKKVRRPERRQTNDPSGEIVRSRRGKQGIISISAFGSEYETADVLEAARGLQNALNHLLL